MNLMKLPIVLNNLYNPKPGKTFKVRNNQGKIIFLAKFVRPCPSWRDKPPYVYIENPYNEDNINAVDKCWVVKACRPDSFDKGVERTLWIPTFHSKGSILLDPIQVEKEPILEDNIIW